MGVWAKGVMQVEAEMAMFQKSLPCNSLPFLARIKEILGENKTNGLTSLDPGALDKVKACLWVLLVQGYGQFFTLTSHDEFRRLSKAVGGRTVKVEEFLREQDFELVSESLDALGYGLREWKKADGSEEVLLTVVINKVDRGTDNDSGGG